ncbi:MAG: hypothetical protein AAGN35_17340 [Bacteroidota bacterium]
MNNIQTSTVILSDRIWEDCSVDGQPIKHQECLDKYITSILDEDRAEFIGYNLIVNSEFYNYSLLLRIDGLWENFDRQTLEQVLELCSSDYSHLYSACNFFAGLLKFDIISWIQGANSIDNELRKSIIDSFKRRIKYFSEIDLVVIAECGIELQQFRYLALKLKRDGVPIMEGG